MKETIGLGDSLGRCNLQAERYEGWRKMHNKPWGVTLSGTLMDTEKETEGPRQFQVLINSVPRGWEWKPGRAMGWRCVKTDENYGCHGGL